MNKELELSVRKRFNPNEVSRSTIHCALRNGFSLVVIDYESKKRIGRFVETTLGTKFIRFEESPATGYWLHKR
jgi:hypothetical protein